MANSEVIRVLVQPTRPPLVVKLAKPESIPVHLVPSVTIAGSGQSTFSWIQSIALAIWTIPHNLKRFPSVTVVDSLGNRVEPDVKYIDANIVQVIHGSPFAGTAYIN